AAGSAAASSTRTCTWPSAGGNRRWPAGWSRSGTWVRRGPGHWPGAPGRSGRHPGCRRGGGAGPCRPRPRGHRRGAGGGAGSRWPPGRWARGAAPGGSGDSAVAAVRGLAADGVDVVKIVLESGAGWPVPQPPVVRAVVETAHGLGLPVVAHALTADLVTRALDAGVDELAHTPVERLTEPLVDRIAAAGIPVVSTLQTFFSGGPGRNLAANAAAPPP